MRRQLLFSLFCFLFFSSYLLGETITPNQKEFSLLNHKFNLNQIDSNLFMGSVTIRNTSNQNQTYVIESAQSGTNNITVYSKYDAIKLQSELINTAQYFFSNILQYKILIPPNKSETLKFDVISTEKTPVLIIRSEISAQKNKVLTTIILGVFYGVSLTIIFYLLFLFASTLKTEITWLIAYLLLALIFLMNRLGLITPYLPASITLYPLFLDDLIVQLSIFTFILFTLSLVKPQKKWRQILFLLITGKTMLFIIALLWFDDHVAIFSISRKYSGLATLVFIPLFYTHYKNQKTLFYMFVFAMLGIALTNAYLNHIDYQSIIETPNNYFLLLSPFIIHMIMLAGTFLLDLQYMAEEKEHMAINVLRIKKENHASFIKGTQTEQKNLATKIELSILNPIIALQPKVLSINPQVQIEIKNTQRDLKRIIRGINPQNSDIEDEFETIINSLRASRKYNLNVFHTSKTISTELKNTLVRITQEAINNIEKHANATQVNIDFFKTNATYFLSIYDNGDGFDPYQSKGGIGLKNMKKYTEEQDGKFTISSNPQQGTTLLFSFKQDVT